MKIQRYGSGSTTFTKVGYLLTCFALRDEYDWRGGDAQVIMHIEVP